MSPNELAERIRAERDQIVRRALDALAEEKVDASSEAQRRLTASIDRAAASALERVIRLVETEEARISDALRTSEARNRAVLESALDCVISMDHLGRIVDFNPAAERTFGHTRAAVLGRELAETLIPPSLREAHRRGLARYLATGEQRIISRRVELTGLRADGSEFPIELTVVPIPGANGAPPLFTAYLRDLSELVHAERERDLFLAALGHDLRTPLTAIQLAAQLCQREDRDEGRRAAQRIVSSARRMGRLIEQLLDFARAQVGGGLPIDRRPTDLAEICREVLSEAEVASKETRPRFEGPERLAGSWDHDRLSQLVQNLVSNALQHGARDRPIHVTIATERGGALLEVHNEGPPIPEERLPELFDPFRRGPRKGEGLGLGLYIVHQIASAHGGAVEVSSTAERGTTFRVHLPFDA